MVDLLVIGAGLTGWSAAYTAARSGMQVRVIAKGMGATHWSAGTIDVLGYLPPSDGQAIRHPLAALTQLAEAAPAHPYARLRSSALQTALDGFAALSTEMALPYRGADAGRNMLLPSPVGTARPVYLAPAAQLAGRLDRTEPMLIVGFQGLRDFYPDLIAENLNKMGQPARSAHLPLETISDRRDFNNVQLAKGLETPVRRARLAAALAKLVEPGERIGLPAILGMDDHALVLTDLETQAEAPIFEIPTLPPSVPGIRLHTALCRHLNRMNVRVEAGMAVTGGKAKDGRIQWVESQTSARPLKHRARHFLLATGGILGGGFNSDPSGRIWEVIFDLPLTTPQQRSRWFHPHFLSPTGQPVFQGGVAVNGRFQPVNSDDEVVYTNLWAAGSVLAHADPIRERSREGIAIGTGMAAAQAIGQSTDESTTENV